MRCTLQPLSEVHLKFKCLFAFDVLMCWFAFTSAFGWLTKSWQSGLIISLQEVVDHSNFEKLRWNMKHNYLEFLRGGAASCSWGLSEFFLVWLKKFMVSNSAVVKTLRPPWAVGSEKVSAFLQWRDTEEMSVECWGRPCWKVYVIRLILFRYNFLSHYLSQRPS